MKAYIPSSPVEREEMLQSLGIDSALDLFSNLPQDLMVEDLDVPEGLSEMELWQFIEKLAQKNKNYSSIWRGAGSYHHYIPAIVSQVMSKERFITSYTPYQAEISQGILQSIFEYQTSICELTGMEASNASLYDGASALAEAARMCVSRKKNKVLLAGHIHPQVVETVQTYYFGDTIEIQVVEAGVDGTIDLDILAQELNDDVAGVCFQQPNYLGLLEDARAIIDLVHEQDALVVMSVNPSTLGVLEAPGVLGADIAVGEGQSMGLPLSFGGPYVGFMASTDKLKRQLPGRIVGQTVDKNGKRSYVLTMQAREQHIRREKAQSNVCTNQALCAMQVSAYLNSVGAEGLNRQGMWSFYNAHALAEDLRELGFEPVNAGPFFHEFYVRTPISAYRIEEILGDENILSGLPIDDEHMLWCATEMNTEVARAHLIEILRREL